MVAKFVNLWASILKLIKKYNLILIEIISETIGSKWKNKMCGSFGIGCFSFFPTKNITTGEGGMITTNDKKIYELCILNILELINLLFKEKVSKKAWNKIASLPGHNYRMSNLLAGIGLVQLSKLDTLNKKRCKLANIYNKKFQLYNDQIKIPITAKYTNHFYQTYSILVDKKR